MHFAAYAGFSAPKTVVKPAANGFSFGFSPPEASAAAENDKAEPADLNAEGEPPKEGEADVPAADAGQAEKRYALLP